MGLHLSFPRAAGLEEMEVCRFGAIGPLLAIEDHLRQFAKRKECPFRNQQGFSLQRLDVDVYAVVECVSSGRRLEVVQQGNESSCVSAI